MSPAHGMEARISRTSAPTVAPSGADLEARDRTVSFQVCRRSPYHRGSVLPTRVPGHAAERPLAHAEECLRTAARFRRAAGMPSAKPDEFGAAELSYPSRTMSMKRPDRVVRK
jgi:hypothetical protein